MKELREFLVRAKMSTYAANLGTTAPSRPGSKDFRFAENGFVYQDSYFGEKDFSGQEIVYRAGIPAWSMNYYGKMFAPDPPPGFAETLHEALLRVSTAQPFRGPAEYSHGAYRYECRVEGDIGFFRGEESIFHEQAEVYRLYFHGGAIDG